MDDVEDTRTNAAEKISIEIVRTKAAKIRIKEQDKLEDLEDTRTKQQRRPQQR